MQFYRGCLLVLTATSGAALPDATSDPQSVTYTRIPYWSLPCQIDSCSTLNPCCLNPKPQATEASTGQFLSAASRGEVDRVKLMLQQGFPPDSADYDGRTALMLAATHNHKVRGGRVAFWCGVTSAAINTSLSTVLHEAWWL